MNCNVVVTIDDYSTLYQTALLYTDVYGRRRLRVHNLSLNCSSKFPDIYRSCEIDTLINFLSKSSKLFFHLEEVKVMETVAYKVICHPFLNFLKY